MVINIGDLWDRPIPIADEKLLLPSLYSDIECTESERITFRSYNRETYQSHQGYDGSDSIYFKSLSPEVCYQAEINVQGNGIGYLGSRCENNIKECDDNKDGEEISPARPKGSFSHEVSPDLEGDKDELKVDIKKSGGAGKSMCPHASKAFRVRSSTAKDRHSKVSTAKGLRDRRVRLSVSTAVRFYDIQDRLGFDHPSKALDWLMSKARSAIDELPEASYIYPLKCSACNSVSKSTSLDPDFISTSGANTKAGYSDDALQAKNLTQINGPGGACVQKSTKAVTTKKSIAEIKKTAKEGEEAKGPVKNTFPVSVMQSGSQASEPSVRGTSSKLKTLRSGRHSGGTKIAMLDCPTQQENCADTGLNIYGNANQLLPAVYTSCTTDIAMSTTCAQHEDLEICWKAFDMIHGNTNGIASFETYIRTCASSSHGIDNMLVDTDLSSCSLLNVFNASGISQLTSRPRDVSSTSSSSSECEHSAPRIQAW